MSTVLESARRHFAAGRIVPSEPHGYNISRTFDPEVKYGNSYDEFLWFRKKTVSAVIEEKLQTSDNPIRVLDVGVGKGNYLLGVKEKYGENVVCDGINNFPYHNADAMQQAGIQIKLGDIQTMPLPRDQYDVITAMHSLEYTQNPLWALKRLYLAAKLGGIVLINPLTMMFAHKADTGNFVSFLENSQDFDVVGPHGNSGGAQQWVVSFRKQQERLVLPIAIADFIELQQTNFAGGIGETMKWMQAKYRFVR